MNAVIGALRAILGMDTVAFEKGVGIAQKEIRALDKTFQSTAKSLDKVGKQMSVAVTAPLLAMRAIVTATAANFEEAMIRVQAATQGTREEMAKLADMARKIGPAAGFSATEAAQAMEALAKNGLSITQIMEGAAEATVKLAAANGAQLAPAADIVSDAMNTFNKEAKDLPGVVDQITGTLIASKFGFDDYKLAIGQAAGVAGKVGVTFEDFNAALAVTSSSFASGSDAGTSFKTFLSRLSPASKEAKDAIESLKLEFFDSSGAMLSMEKIADNLKKGLGDLSDQARINVATKIFGTDAMRTGLALADKGGDAIRKMREEIAKVSATDQAEARLKGFNGAVKQLKAAIEGLSIAIGDSGLLASATAFVKMLTDLVKRVSALNPELLRLGTIAASVAIAIGPLTLAAGYIVSGFGNAIVVLSRVVPLLAGVIAAAAPFAGVAVAIAAAAAGVLLFADQIPIASDGSLMLSDALHAVVEEGKRFNKWLDENDGPLETLGRHLRDIATTALPAIVGWMGQLAKMGLQGFADLTVKELDIIIGGFSGAYSAIVAMWENLSPVLSEAVVNMANSVLAKVREWLNGVVGLLNTVREKVGATPLPLLPMAAWANENAGAAERAGKEIAEAFKKGWLQNVASDALARMTLDANTAAINRQLGQPGPDYPIANKTDPKPAAPPGGGKGGRQLADGGDDGQKGALKRLKEFLAENARAVELERMAADQRAISEALYKAEALAKEAGIKLTKDDTAAITANVLALRDAKKETEEKERLEKLAKATIEETKTSTEKYNDVLRDLQVLLATGAISQEQFTRAQELAVENMRGGKGEWSTQWASFADAVTDASRQVAADLTDLDQDIGTTLANLAKRIAQFALEILVLQPIFDAVGKMIKSAVSPDAGGGGTGWISSLISMAASAARSFFGGSTGSLDPSVTSPRYGGPRAGGGPVDVGSWYDINERGKEAFVPGTPGQVISAKDLASMGERAEVRQYINIMPDVRQTAKAMVLEMLPTIANAGAEAARAKRARGGIYKEAFSR